MTARDRSDRLDRRRVLELAASAAATGLAGCNSASGPSARVETAWGILNEGTTVVVALPRGAETPPIPEVDATIEHETAKSASPAEVAKVGERSYRIVGPAPPFVGPVKTKVRLDGSEASYSVAPEVAVAPRPFVTSNYLGFDYGRGYRPTTERTGAEPIVEAFRSSDALQGMRSRSREITDLGDTVGVRGDGLAGVVGRLAYLQRPRIGIISGQDGTNRVAAFVPVLGEEGPYITDEATLEYGSTITPVVTVTQGGGVDSIEVGLRSSDGEFASMAFDWDRSEQGIYALLPFETLSLPDDPQATGTNAVELVAFHDSEPGRAATLRLRRDLTQLPVRESLVESFETPGTGYAPSNWIRRTNGGGALRATGRGGLRLAPNPFSYVALVSKGRFEPPVRLEFTVSGWKSAPDSAVYVGWLNPRRYLDDGFRVRPRKFTPDAACAAFLESELRLLAIEDSPLAANRGDPWAGVSVVGRPRERLDWQANPAHRFVLEWTRETVSLTMDGDPLFERTGNVPTGGFPLYLVGGEWGGRNSSLLFFEDVRVSKPGQ